MSYGDPRCQEISLVSQQYGTGRKKRTHRSTGQKTEPGNKPVTARSRSLQQRRKKIHDQRDTVSSTSGTGEDWTALRRGTTQDHVLIPHAQLSPEWTEAPNVGPKTTKTLQESTGGHLSDIGHNTTLATPSPGLHAPGCTPGAGTILRLSWVP